jgi:hypothetical protein
VYYTGLSLKKSGKSKRISEGPGSFSEVSAIWSLYLELEGNELFRQTSSDPSNHATVKYVLSSGTKARAAQQPLAGDLAERSALGQAPEADR